MDIVDIFVIQSRTNVYYTTFNDDTVPLDIVYYHTFQNANVDFVRQDDRQYFTVDNPSAIMFVKVDPSKMITQSIMTNELVLSYTYTEQTNLEYTFTNASDPNKVTTIYSNKDLFTHYIDEFQTDLERVVRDEPVYRYSKISFDFNEDFPMSARKIDFTVFIEYTCQGNIAEIELFKETNVIDIPDSNGVRTLLILKFYPNKHELISYIKTFSDDYILSENAEKYKNHTEFHLCGCHAHDFIHITAQREIDNQFFILHNVSVIQGIIEDDASYLNNGTVNNIFMGTDSGFSNSGGVNNVFIGNNSGKQNVGGTDNVFLGYKCGEKNEGGNNNVFIGTECGIENSIGYNNVFIGYKCGFTNTTGYNNIFIGYECGFRNTIGHDNVFIGQRAGYYNETGSFNMIIGAETKGNVENVNEDYYNTIRMIKRSVEGFIAETKLAIDRLGDIEGDTSDFNSVLGVKAAEAYVDGTATGSNNLFCGSFNAKNVINGDNNTAIGAMVAPMATSLSSNTLIGALCAANVGDDFGSHNISVGTMSSLNQSQCFHNISIGEMSSANQSFSNDNISIGRSSAFGMMNGHNNVTIGTQAGYKSAHAEVVQLIHLFEENETTDPAKHTTLVSNFDVYMELSNVSLLSSSTIDLSNLDVSYSLVLEPQMAFIEELSNNAYMHTSFKQLSHDDVANIFLSGNVYAYISPPSGWMNVEHFVTSFNTRQVFSNVDFSLMNVGDVILDSFGVSNMTYFVTFLHNSYNDEYVYSSKCIGSTLPWFNIICNHELLSGYIVVQNSTITYKIHVDTEKRIQFISTYMA